MKVFIMGNRGRMGKLLTGLFRDLGHEVKGFDILDGTAEPDSVEMQQADVILLSIPQEKALQFCLSHPEFKNVVEIGSTKSIMKNLRGRIISIHPLFGPLSYESGNRRKIFFIDDISPEGSIDLIGKLFGRMEMIPIGYDNHDRLMAEMLVTPYIISLISSGLSTGREPMTRSAEVLEQVSLISKLQSQEVMNMSIFLNPYSRSVFENIKSSLETLMGDVK